MKGNGLSAAQGYLDNTPKWGDIQICLITCWAAIEYNKLHNTNMKKLIVTTFLVASSVILLSGCMSANCHRNTQCCRATLGQQLLDLKTAQAMGAITEEEFQTLKAKLIGNK
jgi:hypothetical protein